MQKATICSTILLTLLLQSLSSASTITEYGEGGETIESAVWVDQWPVEATGYTCDNVGNYFSMNCIEYGNDEEVVYKFKTPLGVGLLNGKLCSQDGHRTVLFVGNDPEIYSGCGEPYPDWEGCGYYSSKLTDIRLSQGGEYYVFVDGHCISCSEGGCGYYYLNLEFTPQYLGHKGNKGTGGTGGTGGLSGGGGIPCSVQNGYDGFPGASGQPGGVGCAGALAKLQIFSPYTLSNSSWFAVGGSVGPTGQTGADGSTGGQGGHGGAPYANGGGGLEPVPDYQPNDTNGGAAGIWPSGTGGNGNNSGGGGGGGGSSAGVGGGYGAGGGAGAQGADGSGNIWPTPPSLSQMLETNFTLDNPFILGGRGGEGGGGGQGGHGGGGGGGAGECWFNPAGVGGTGGAGGSGGAGGAGGPGGPGVMEILGGQFLNYDSLTVGNSGSGGSGLVQIATGGQLINGPSGVITIAANGTIEMNDASAIITNNGLITMPYSSLENHGTYTGIGTLAGEFQNYYNFVAGNGYGISTVSVYHEYSHLVIHVGGASGENDLFSGVEVENNLVLDSGSTLVLQFINGCNESVLNYGDFFDIVRYPYGGRSGEFGAVDDALAPLEYGVWDVVYDYDLGEGSSVRLVYDQALSSVESGSVPARFGLDEVFPNPFNPRTTIGYDLPRASVVKFCVFDIAGRQVWEMVSDLMPAGHHELVWNGVDGSGRGLASGTYLLRMSSGGFEGTRRMVLVR